MNRNDLIATLMRKQAAKSASTGDATLTELEAAGRLKLLHRDKLRHTTGRGWHRWNGKYWEPSQKAAERAAHEIGQVVRDELHDLHAMNGKVAGKYIQHAVRIESNSGVKAVLGLAKSLEGIDGDSIKWDSHSWLLNCPNGTVDLKTGIIRPHDRADFITKLCPTAYDPKATCPLWKDTLRKIFKGDTDLIRYVRWCMGYSLTGCTDYDVFFILHGSGANGKTTMLSTLQHVLGGGYAQQLHPEEIMQQHHARHTTELAALAGARLVCVVETNEGRRLNESFIKGLTGGDPIRARFMRQDSFEFIPECKLWLSTNYPPRVQDTSVAMRRRLRLIPFGVSFKGSGCDPGLADKLKREAEGILAWCLRGAMRVEKGEPKLPKAVDIATAEFFAANDVVRQFLDSECVKNPNVKCMKSALYRAYKSYTNNHCESAIEFNKKIAKRGYRGGKIRGIEMWYGLQIADSIMP